MSHLRREVLFELLRAHHQMAKQTSIYPMCHLVQVLLQVSQGSHTTVVKKPAVFRSSSRTWVHLHATWQVCDLCVGSLRGVPYHHQHGALFRRAVLAYRAMYHFFHRRLHRCRALHVDLGLMLRLCAVVLLDGRRNIQGD